MNTFPALLADFDPTKSAAGVNPLAAELWRDIPDPRNFVVGSVEELMGHAIRTAQRTCLSGIGGKRGGPFGAAGAIPHGARIDGVETLFEHWFKSISPDEVMKYPLRMGDVTSWKMIALGVNLVDIFDNAALHAEMVAGTHITVATGRNWWKRFVLAVTSGAPCGMCESFFTWACPRYVVGGAPLAGAVSAGLHEALPPALVQSIRVNPAAHTAESEAWVANLRGRGVEVVHGVCGKQVVEELYAPYLATGGVLYNSGPDDPTG